MVAGQKFREEEAKMSNQGSLPLISTLSRDILGKVKEIPLI